MGLPMARNLARSGLDVRAWNRSPERAQPLAQDGVTVCPEASAAADGAELVLTMLSDADAVLEVARHALPRMAPRAVWIQASTIGIEGTERCAELADQAGVTLVDSPVLGTRQPAQDAKLVILASGPEQAVSRCQPIFDAIGQRTIRLGDVGQGTRCKVAVNSWIVGVVGVLAETIALAEALDIDPQRFFDAVEGGALDLPYARIKGKAMIERSFEDPDFRLALSRKDAELVLAAASEAELDLPIMAATAHRLREAEAAGHGDEDMAATYWASAPAAVSARETA